MNDAEYLGNRKREAEELVRTARDDKEAEYYRGVVAGLNLAIVILEGTLD
jgi:hypothetical protein